MSWLWPITRNRYGVWHFSPPSGASLSVISRRSTVSPETISRWALFCLFYAQDRRRASGDRKANVPFLLSLSLLTINAVWYIGPPYIFIVSLEFFFCFVCCRVVCVLVYRWWAGEIGGSSARAIRISKSSNEWKINDKGNRNRKEKEEEPEGRELVLLLLLLFPSWRCTR